MPSDGQANPIGPFRRRKVRRFPVQVTPETEERFTSRIAFGAAAMALVVAGALTIFDMALRTADAIFIEEAHEVMPEKLRMSFGRHHLNVPGEWVAVRKGDFESANRTLTVNVPFEDLLLTLGQDPGLAGERPDVGIMFRTPENPLSPFQTLEAIYLGKTAPFGAGPAGLIRRKFSEGSGYEGESLYVGRDGTVEPFIARCFESQSDVVKRPCIRTIRLSNELDMTIQFSRDLLPDWRKLDPAVAQLVQDFSAPL